MNELSKISEVQGPSTSEPAVGMSTGIYFLQEETDARCISQLQFPYRPAVWIISRALPDYRNKDLTTRAAAVPSSLELYRSAKIS